jgi:hypothetical protein
VYEPLFHKVKKSKVIYRRKVWYTENKKETFYRTKYIPQGKRFEDFPEQKNQMFAQQPFQQALSAQFRVNHTGQSFHKKKENPKHFKTAYKGHDDFSIRSGPTSDLYAPCERCLFPI